MPKPSLCLNMIVKNEAARMERCLRSALPYVKAAVICDTGSTDETGSIIERVCKEYEVPYTIAKAEFVDFSQARNAAFTAARIARGTAVPWCQFALLMDADMQLVVTDPWTFDNLDAMAGSYDMMQKGGSVTYANRRIVNLDWPKAPYVGVTHEYIDIPVAGMITGARFIDHADGSNRADKYQRDATLLTEALKTEPENGRYLYYLGQTFMDWGATVPTVLPLAIDAFQKRVTLGGWDEETFMSLFNSAKCERAREHDDAFKAGMIEAYNFRPRRAEPLYELAKFYREKGQNAAALLFAKSGAQIQRPDDLLFVDDFVYSHGLRYEYSIAGFYDEKERGRAFEVTDDLALDPDCPQQLRLSARDNLYHFTKPLSHYCPSFKATRLEFDAPEGYTAMNPSIEELDGRLTCNIRCVNYTMDKDGRYLINRTGGEANGTNPIDTRNFIALLNSRDLKISHSTELRWDRPVGPFDLVTGLEDVRLWRYQGDLWFNACVREQSKFGTCQQAIGRIAMGLQGATVHNFKVVSGDDIHEKNWMHFDDQRFVYRLNTIIDPLGPRATEKFDVKICVDNISGSSQLIEFKAGWLAVVHEAITGPDGKRTYWHRFAWFDHDGKVRRLSLPFVFFDRQIEFCAGLAYHPNHNDLILSFGVRDAEAHLATVSIEDVARMVWTFYED